MYKYVCIVCFVCVCVLWDILSYVDIKKKDLKGLNYDKIYNFLTKFDKKHRLERYKHLLKFNDIKFEADVFTWCSD